MHSLLFRFQFINHKISDTGINKHEQKGSQPGMKDMGLPEKLQVVGKLEPNSLGSEPQTGKANPFSSFYSSEGNVCEGEQA